MKGEGEGVWGCSSEGRGVRVCGGAVVKGEGESVGGCSSEGSE